MGNYLFSVSNYLMLLKCFRSSRLTVKWKMSFQSEKSWCHFSLQTKRFGFPKLIALEDYQDKLLPQFTIFPWACYFLFQICKRPCPRSAFLANSLFKRRKKRQQIQGCVCCWLSLWPLCHLAAFPPCTVHSFASFGSQALGSVLRG